MIKEKTVEQMSLEELRAELARSEREDSLFNIFTHEWRRQLRVAIQKQATEAGEGGTDNV